MSSPRTTVPYQSQLKFESRCGSGSLESAKRRVGVRLGKRISFRKPRCETCSEAAMNQGTLAPTIRRCRTQCLPMGVLYPIPTKTALQVKPSVERKRGRKWGESHGRTMNSMELNRSHRQWFAFLDWPTFMHALACSASERQALDTVDAHTRTPLDRHRSARLLVPAYKYSTCDRYGCRCKNSHPRNGDFKIALQLTFAQNFALIPNHPSCNRSGRQVGLCQPA